MASSRRSTLNDLAESLGLSANTVSRALTGKDGVSPRTREIVLNEARRIGYLVRPTAATDSASKIIALAIPSSTHMFSAELVDAVEASARAAGYSLDLQITEENEAQEERIVSTVLDAGLAGAIVVPVQGRSKPWSRLSATGTPLVTVSREIPGLDCDFVGADSAAGEYAATKHLLHLGSRSVVLFEEDLNISTIERRLEAFRSAVAEYEGSRHRIVTVPTRRYENGDSSWRAEEAYRVCVQLLEAGRDFDAIATGDDFFALGAARALIERGIRVPEDVRIVGYGDHPYAAWVTPSLSSVKLPTQLIGEVAVSLLLKRLGGDISAPVKRFIRPELVIRESTAGVLTAR